MKNYINTNYDFNDPELVSIIDEVPFWSAPFGLSLLDTIDYRKNISVLDIGFGTGFPILEMAMRLGNTCKVYGIDPWDAAIERTKLKIKFYNLSNVNLFKGFAEHIPLSDSSIELIVSNNGINNVQDIKQTFAECSRISKSKAQFVFTMNLDTTMQEFYDIYYEILEKNNMESEKEKVKMHIYEKRKPIDEICALLVKSDFMIKDVNKKEFYYRYVDGTAMLNHFFINLGFMESWLKILDKDKQKDIFSQIEKRINEIYMNKSFVLTVPFATFNCYKQ